MSEAMGVSRTRRMAALLLSVVLGLCLLALVYAKESSPGWYAEQELSFRIYWNVLLLLVAWAIYRVAPLAFLGVEEKTVHMIQGRPFRVMVIGAILLLAGLVLLGTSAFIVGTAVGVVGFVLILIGILWSMFLDYGRRWIAK